MSNRRARVQYGKISKRVNSRIASEIVEISPQEDEIATQDDVHQGAISKDVKTRRNSSKGAISRESKDAVQKRVSQRRNNEGSRSPARRNESTVDIVPAKRKRKRNASPANSDSTDVVEETAPAPKALKALSGGSPTKKIVSSSVTPGTRDTPPRATTPSKPKVSTPRITRDLSDLFISPHKPSTSTMATSPPKPGVLKRMLSKAKTEPALEESSVRVDLFPSKSTVISSPPRDPTTLSTTPNITLPSFNRHPLARDHTPSPSPLQDIRPVSRSPQRLGRTYSKSRSFLVEIPPDSMDIDNEAPKASPSKKPLVPDDSALKDIHRESYSELRSRWGIDSSDYDPTLNTPVNDLNSIGEMRSRGETRRFLDEVGYLFDGLDPSSGRGNTGAKRASAIEIVSKMGDPEFSRRAVAANFVGKAWSMLRSAGAGTGEDKILDAALIAFAALSMKDPRHAIELSRTPDLLPFLSLSIGVIPDEDVLVAPPADQESSWARRLGLSRVDRTSLTVLRAAVANSLTLRDDHVASHRLVAAETLSSLLEFGRPLTGDVLDSVLASLSSELAHRDSQIHLDSQPLSDLRYTRTCLRIAEKVVTSQPGSISKQMELIPLLAQLVNSWPAQVGARNLSSDLDETAQLALQYLVRATHNRPELCELLVEQPRVMHNLLRLFARWYREHFSGSAKQAEPTSVDEEQSDCLTRASLCLGLVTQLVKEGDAAKLSLRETRMASLCPLTGTCAEKCDCDAQLSGVDILVEIFDESDEGRDAKADYFKGHIGILLSLLCLHNPESRASVLSSLQPQQGSEKEKVQTLLETVREFSTILSAVVNTVGKGEESSSDSGQGEVSQDEGVQLAQTVMEGLETLLKEDL